MESQHPATVNHRERADIYKKIHNETEHLLLSISKSYQISTVDLAPQDCEYNLTEGAWVLQDTGLLLVETPGRPMPATKKQDIETGEDQKGE